MNHVGSRSRRVIPVDGNYSSKLLRQRYEIVSFIMPHTYEYNMHSGWFRTLNCFRFYMWWFPSGNQVIAVAVFP